MYAPHIPPTFEEHLMRAALPALRLLIGYLPLERQRAGIAREKARAAALPGVRSEHVSADGVPCEWLIPDGARADAVLLYLHGGGFVLGLMQPQRAMVAALAQQVGARVLAVDYRLAPEHPYPAALDDCYAAYRWLLAQGVAPANVVAAGDSAGGNLTLTTLLKAKQAGDPLPAGALCLSPAVNMEDRGDAPYQGVYEPMLHPRAVRLFLDSYVGARDGRDPLLSPLYGDLRGLPPLLIHIGEHELLRPDVLAFDERARAADVDVRTVVYPRMWHVWQLSPSLPQAQHALADAAAFIRARLAGAQHVG